MHPFSKVLLGAATLPALAHALSLPNPANAGVPVPAVAPLPAFSDYRRYQDDPPADWHRSNRLVSPVATPPNAQRGADRGPAKPAHRHPTAVPNAGPIANVGRAG